MRSVLRLLAPISLVVLAYAISPVHPASAFPPYCNQVQPTMTGSGTIKGTKDADIIFGSKKADRIYGGGGDDFICGGGGGDLIFGDDGNDVIYGEGGNDEISGGPGNDYIEGDIMNQPSLIGNDTVHGDAGNDHLWDGAGANLFDGGDGDDYVSTLGTALGGPGNDEEVRAAETCTGCGDGYADGGSDNDYVYVWGEIADGGTGNDRVSGASVGDEVYGDDGADLLSASADCILVDAGYGIDSCAPFGFTTLTLISCEFIV